METDVYLEDRAFTFGSDQIYFSQSSFSIWRFATRLGFAIQFERKAPVFHQCDQYVLTNEDIKEEIYL